MGLSIVQKILDTYIVEGKKEVGKEVGIRIDQTLTQDATGTMAYLQFEAINVPEVKTDLSVSYVDHNTVQIGSENADDHLYLQTVAANYGVVFSRAGNGICHQVHLERFAIPGKTLLGADSHTPTCGGIGMLAIGAGGLDVALAMAGEIFYFPFPRVVRINLSGKLHPWVSAKDIILKVLDLFSTRGNVGTVFEYGGDGVKYLSVPERATIANMGAECGVTTSIFPSDEITKAFLKSQEREESWVELSADSHAGYHQVVHINLDELEPLVALPHSPGNIRRVADIEGMPVDQVCIGSCTNSSYRDLMVVARILENRKVNPGTSLVVAPGSKQVIENIARDGGLEMLLSSGARFVETACGFCVGNSHAPRTGSTSLRTNNRNFEGRSGTKSARVYLVSPETAAAAVITGKITDPRKLEAMEGISYPAFSMPENYYIDDSMIIYPPKNPGGVEVYRGPNIGEVPFGLEIPKDIQGMVTIKVGDKVTTDHITPAGARLKYRSNVGKYSEFVFESIDPTFSKRAKKVQESGTFNVIVAGESYGQGSSREHAALCPMYLGVKAVLAKSIERIHKANLINFGLLPLTFFNGEDYNNIDEMDELVIRDIHFQLKRGNRVCITNKSKRITFDAICDVSSREIEVLLAGGALPYLKKNRSSFCVDNRDMEGR